MDFRSRSAFWIRRYTSSAAPRGLDGEIATLPHADAKEKKALVAKYTDYGANAAGDLKKLMPALLSRVEQLHEFNPMLGHRGCRLGITYPEITEMQARAIFEAAVEVTKKGVKVLPEVMIPLVATVKEMANQAAIVRRVAEEVFKEKGMKIDYLVGTMIELPRAALVADEIAKEAEFFSLWDQRSDADNLGIITRRCQQDSAYLPRRRDHQGGPVCSAGSGGRWTTGEDGDGTRAQDPS